MTDCIFCAIGAHRAAAEIICEDEETISFMDISPVAEGHCLVIPKAHARNILDIAPESAAAVTRMAVRVARAVNRAQQADGLNVWQSNEPVAGQTVFHYHVHIIPRWQGDGGIRFANRGRAPVVELRRVADKIRAELASLEPQR